MSTIQERAVAAYVKLGWEQKPDAMEREYSGASRVWLQIKDEQCERELLIGITPSGDVCLDSAQWMEGIK